MKKCVSRDRNPQNYAKIDEFKSNQGCFYYYMRHLAV